MATIAVIIASLFVIALIFLLIVARDLGGFPAELRAIGALLFQTVPGLTILLIIILILLAILVGLITAYYLKIFALHVNMMNIAAVNRNLHHHDLLINF